MKVTDHRTQVYLTADQYRAAKRLAAERGLSLAGVIREALGEYLESAGSGERSARWAGDPVEELPGIFELPPLAAGGDDLDEAVDQSVYDEV